MGQKLRNRKYFNIYGALTDDEISLLKIRAIEYIIDGTHLDCETISLGDMVADLFFRKLSGLDSLTEKQIKAWLAERNEKYIY